MEPTTTSQGNYAGGYADELTPGTTLLHGQYVIESFLNSGGFGMTYLAKDSLDRRIVIKECFPASFCCRNETDVRARSRSQDKEFNSIVRLFGQEARRLSKLDHPNIVGVHQVFEDNQTAYMALDYVEGLDLLDILEQQSHKLNPAKIRMMLMKILDAVSYIHDKNILHRDISPDNILLDKFDNPVLIDFGAAREKATKASRALSALLVVKDGYSPQEFYITGSVQAPCSDLYALAATFYHLIAGEAPPNSQERLAALVANEADPYVSLKKRSSGYDEDFINAIDKTLNVLPKDRIQTAQDWMAAIDLEKRKEVALAKAESDESTTLAISRLVIESNRVALDDVKKDIKKPAPAVVKSVAVHSPRKRTNDRIIAKQDIFMDVAEEPLILVRKPVTNFILMIVERSAALKNSKIAEARKLRKFRFFGKPKATYVGKADQ